MSKQKIQLSDHFDYSRLIRFVLPCIGTMLFTSIYGIVDGLCVSNFVGKTAFAAVNLIMPVPMLVGTVALCWAPAAAPLWASHWARAIKPVRPLFQPVYVNGADRRHRAVRAGDAAAPAGGLMLGAEGEMLDYALRYGRVLMLSLPTFILQNMFQSFFVTAEKPHLAFTSRWARAAPTWCWTCCWWASCTGAWRVPPLPPCSAR